MKIIAKNLKSQISKKKGYSYEVKSLKVIIIIPKLNK